MVSNKQHLLPCSYLAPIGYYAILLQHPSCIIEQYDFFVKQTIRNRCAILGANGKLILSIPKKRKSSSKTILKEIQISYDAPWQKLHWKSITSAYRSSAYFEYYEDLFLSPSVSSFYESLKTTSTASNTLKKQRGTYFDTDIDYTLDFDKRDQKFQTSDGFRSRFTQSIPLISKTNALLNGYEFNLYEEIADDMVGEFTFYIRAINSLTDDDVRISERLFLPQSRLRGFERGKIGPKDGQEFIGGNYASSVNLSTSLPTIFNDLETLDFSIFLDAGNVWGVDYESTLDESNKLRSSTGIAVDWYTIVGPLSFSYSIPISKADTDIEENFRFQIGTTF